MQNNNVFFGESGLTSTSANHIANIAKEYYLSLEKEVNSIDMCTTTVELIGTTNVNILTTGVDADTLYSIRDKLYRIALAKSLIAWLREAIKARESAKKAIERYTLEEYCRDNNIQLPEEPERGHVLTEEEYYNNLNIKERNRYYHLETLCAVLGSYVHPNGSYAKARTSYYDKQNNPAHVSGSGRDALLYKYTPTVEQDDVENVFFELQDAYRRHQAELNGMKHACELAIENSEQEVAEKYKQDYLEYSTKMKELTLQFEDKQREALQNLQSLKIVIPNDLQGIYELVQALR